MNSTDFFGMGIWRSWKSRSTQIGPMFYRKVLSMYTWITITAALGRYYILSLFIALNVELKLVLNSDPFFSKLCWLFQRKSLALFFSIILVILLLLINFVSMIINDYYETIFFNYTILLYALSFNEITILLLVTLWGIDMLVLHL